MADQDRPDHTASNTDWEALARAVAGEGSPADDLRVRQTLHTDPTTAALLGALHDTLSATQIAAPTSADVERALVAVKARRDGPDRQTDVPTQVQSRGNTVLVLNAYRRRWQDARLRAAAAVLVVAGVGLLWRTMSGPSVAATVALNGQSHFVTAVGAIDSLRLPDGSGVLLGPGSELSLANGFAAGTREVTLKGEARFDVVHDATHPFIVHTPSASFRDVGTVFSVHSDGGEGARVVVTAGAVAVESTGSRRQVTLKAGDCAQIVAAGDVRVQRSGVTAEDIAWMSGRLVFRDASVAQVAADLRRWYGVELIVDSAFVNKTVTVTFRRDEAKSVGSVVAALLGGRLQSMGDTLQIVAPTPAVRK